MIGLVFTACLSYNLSECKEVKIAFPEIESATPQQCMKNGQIELSKWHEENPNWQIKIWKCDDLSRPKYKI